MHLFVPSGDDGDDHDDGNGTPLKLLMLMLMMVVAHLSNCFLRWLLGRDRPESAALAGALAGLASFNYRFLFLASFNYRFLFLASFTYR